MEKRILSIIISVSVLLMLFVPAGVFSAFAEESSEDCVVTKVETETQSLKSGDALVITVYTSGTDELRGDWSVVWLERDVEDEYADYGTEKSAKLVKNGSGKYTATFNIDDGWPTGAYKIEQINMYYEKSSPHIYYREFGNEDGLVPDVTYNVKTNNKDAEAPTLTKVEATSQKVHLGESFTVAIYAEDENGIDLDESGIQIASIPYSNSGSERRLQDQGNGKYEAVFNIDDRWWLGSGDYKLDTIRLYDNLGNFKRYQILTNRFFQEEATVIPDVIYEIIVDDSDAYGPEITKVEATSQNIQPGDTFKITIFANDESGIDVERAYLYLYLTEKEEGAPYYTVKAAKINEIGEGKYEAVYTVDEWTPGEYKIIQFSLADTLGNERFYYNMELSDPENIISDAVFTMLDESEWTIPENTPVITKQPEDVTTKAGKNTEFSVEATGTGLEYQWYYKKAGASNWSVWKNHTAAATTAESNATWDGMQVYCKVTDKNGNSVDSEPATITIMEATKLQITTQPSDVTAVSGTNTSFSVKAEGDGLEYQWYYKKSGASSWSEWKNHTTATTTADANDTWDGMQVFCKVTDQYGNTEKSNPATITIKKSSDLKITSQPEDVTAVAGQNVKFTVAATGDGLKYQWYYKKKGVSSWSIWKNHTTATTSADANDTWDGMQVYCKVTDENGKSVSSEAATISIKESTALKITADPKDVSATVGQNVKFTVVATGDGLKYQWYYKKKGVSSWSVWKNHTTATTSAEANATWDGMQVYCKVTDSAGKSVSSKAATITLKEATPLEITKQPANVKTAVGETVKFSVTAKGDGLKYQWYYMKAGADSFSKWNGHTTATTTATSNSTWDGMQVYCKVTDQYGNMLNSDSATIMINTNELPFIPMD